jgi:4-hydroxybenzoate polyprenyltransferase
MWAAFERFRENPRSTQWFLYVVFSLHIVGMIIVACMALMEDDVDNTLPAQRHGDLWFVYLVHLMVGAVALFLAVFPGKVQSMSLVIISTVSLLFALVCLWMCWMTYSERSRQCQRSVDSATSCKLIDYLRRASWRLFVPFLCYAVTFRGVVSNVLIVFDGPPFAGAATTWAH